MDHFDYSLDQPMDEEESFTAPSSFHEVFQSPMHRGADALGLWHGPPSGTATPVMEDMQLGRSGFNYKAALRDSESRGPSPIHSIMVTEAEMMASSASPSTTPHLATVLQTHVTPAVSISSSSSATNAHVKEMWKRRNVEVVIPKLANGNEIPLGALIQSFKAHGGYHAVRAQKKWLACLREISLPTDKALVSQIKRLYMQFILPLEEAGLLPSHLNQPVFSSAQQHAPQAVMATMAVTPSFTMAAPVGAQVVPALPVAASPVVASAVAPSMATAAPALMVQAHSAIVKAAAPQGSLAAVTAPRVAVEKRLRPWRNEISNAYSRQVQAMLAQRLYLLSRTPGRSGFERCFRVMESVGAVHDVKVGRCHTCDCSAFARTRTLCIHIFFVLHKVMKISTESKYLYQEALLSGEVKHIFASAPVDPREMLALPQRRGSHPMGIHEMLGEPNMGFSADDARFGLDKLSSHASKAKRKDAAHAECAICCEALGSEPLTFCSAQCGSNFHRACMYQYHQSMERCCPLCTVQWDQDETARLFVPMDNGNGAVNPSAFVKLDYHHTVTTMEDAFAQPAYFGSLSMVSQQYQYQQH